MPRLRSSQLLSSCFEAWLKYRPSVDRAALLKEIIAVPAEPEKPEMNSAMDYCERMESGSRGEKAANLGGRRKAQCTRTGGYLPKGRLCARLARFQACRRDRYSQKW